MTKDIRIERHEVNEVGPGETPEITEAPSSAIPPDPAGFSDYIEKTVTATHTPEQLRNLPAFQSADPDQPFVDASNRPPGDVGDAPPALSVSEPPIPEAERRELEQERQRQQMLQAREQDPEFQRARQRLNDQMRQKHPEGFFAGTESPATGDATTALINAAISDANAAPARSGASATAGLRWLWLVVPALLTLRFFVRRFFRGGLH